MHFNLKCLPPFFPPVICAYLAADERWVFLCQRLALNTTVTPEVACDALPGQTTWQTKKTVEFYLFRVPWCMATLEIRVRLSHCRYYYF